MPKLGVDLLDRPLPPLSWRSLLDSWQWVTEGALAAIPDRWRSLGWRPHRNILEMVGGATLPVGVEERSWLGVSRLVSHGGTAATHGPTMLLLDKDSVFETYIDLASAARHTINDAVRLRLDEISPLPTDEVIFAIGDMRDDGRGRLRVNVAIARQSTVPECGIAKDVGEVAEIGYALNSNGRPEFTFRRMRNRGAILRSMAPAMTALIGLATLAVGAEKLAQRNISALEARKASLVALIKDERASASWMNAEFAADRGLSGPEVAAKIDAALTAMPPRVWVEEIALSKAELRIRGFAPDGASWPSTENLTITPTDRPGAVSFVRTETAAP